MNEQSQHERGRCGKVGALVVGGKVVGAVKCELDAGHDDERFDDVGRLHRMTLEWFDDGAPDLDLFDPGESFDVDVPLSGDAMPRRIVEPPTHLFGR